MSEGGELAPGLSPEEQQRSIDRIRELISRKEGGEFNLRPGVPDKAESMLPGIRTVSPASGPGVRYRLEAKSDRVAARGELSAHQPLRLD